LKEGDQAPPFAATTGSGETITLAGLKGTPVILGSLPTFFDMSGMESFYDPRSFVVNLACAEMMMHYQLPHAGTSGSGFGWGPDLLSSGMFWMNHLTSCMGKVGLAPFVGDILGSQAFSPVAIVHAHEIVRQARLLAEGFVLDDASVGLGEISRVGPGGNFLAAPMTRKLFRTAYYKSDIFPVLGLKAWQARGQPRAIDMLRSYTRGLLDRLVPPDDHADLMARGEAFIEGIGRPSGIGG
jgi:trimethylamine--corrinoid protein Co-methyltransferase